MCRQTKPTHTWAFYRLIRWPLDGFLWGQLLCYLPSVCRNPTYYYQHDWLPSQTSNNRVRLAWRRNVKIVTSVTVCFYDQKGSFLILDSFWLAVRALQAMMPPCWCCPGYPHIKSISICTIPDRKTLTVHFCGTALVFFWFLFFSWNILLLCFQKCDAQLWFCFG